MNYEREQRVRMRRRIGRGWLRNSIQHDPEPNSTGDNREENQDAAKAQLALKSVRKQIESAYRAAEKTLKKRLRYLL